MVYMTNLLVTKVPIQGTVFLWDHRMDDIVVDHNVALGNVVVM